MEKEVCQRFQWGKFYEASGDTVLFVGIAAPLAQQPNQLGGLRHFSMCEKYRTLSKILNGTNSLFEVKADTSWRALRYWA